jgi:hypothetical protein
MQPHRELVAHHEPLRKAVREAEQERRYQGLNPADHRGPEVGLM